MVRRHAAAIKRLCPWRKAVAWTMAVVTAGLWVPFAYTMQVDTTPVSEGEDEDSSVPPFIFEPHPAPSWPQQVIPRPVPPPPAIHKHKPPPQLHNPSDSHPQREHIPPPITRPVLPPPVHESAAEILVHFARAQLGKPYVFGGNGPNVWDCSGLTKAAYARVGIYLPRTSEDQSEVGTRVSLSELRQGDLVFWGLPGLAFHVGIYVGGGKIIAAQNPAVGVIEFTLSYYMPSFARRIL